MSVRLELDSFTAAQVERQQQDLLSLSNYVYLNPKHKGLGRFVEIYGYVFGVVYELFIPDNKVIMNGYNREITGAKLKTSITVRNYIESCPEITQLIMSVQFLNRNNEVPTPFSSAELKSLLDVVNNWYISTRQKFVSSINGTRFVLTVQSMKSVNRENQIVDLERGFYSNQKCEVGFVSTPELHVNIVDEYHMAFKFNDIDLSALGIGGVDKQFNDMLRLVFGSRLIHPSLVKKLGIKHKKGVILYGPPGTGKTLMARAIAKMLNTREPKIVNGPEMLDKFVGQSEANIRSLFGDAEAEYRTKGENSGLHTIIFDEIDAICKRRSGSDSGSNVSNNIVNQLLTKIDGVNSLDNILLIGMTNRLDLLDEAILRPGRFGTHIEMFLPDEDGRKQIFQIHTKNMRENGLLDPGVNLDELAVHAKNYTGAEIEAVVQNASSYAIMRQVDPKSLSKSINSLNTKITSNDFEQALKEVRPAFGTNEDEFIDISGMISYNVAYESMLKEMKALVSQLRSSKYFNLMTVLIEGPIGSGKTSIASKIALESKFPYVKCITPMKLVSLTLEASRAAYISQVFNDSYKSTESVIILDNIERLIDYVPIGPRFSNLIMQTIATLVGNTTCKNKLLIIGTTSAPDIMRRLGLGQLFNNGIMVPVVEPENVSSVVAQICPQISVPQSCSTIFSKGVTIKDLLMIVDRVSLGDISFEDYSLQYITQHKLLDLYDDILDI